MSKKEKDIRTKKTMRFGTRVAISFVGLVIIPVTLIASFYIFTLSYRLEQYGIEDASSIYNNALMLSGFTDVSFEELSSVAQTQSALLEDREYLDSINEQFGTELAFLVVRKNGTIIYNGSSDMGTDHLEEILPEYGSQITTQSNWTSILTDEQVMIRQIDFVFPGGEEGSAFIIVNMNTPYPGLQRWLSDILIIGILIFIGTVLVISLLLYKGVSRPIQRLKKATQNIRDGNLDFVVESGNEISEMNELCEDFEEMRKRLKNSQEEKMIFDSENNELIRNISHDLKTPITAVKGYCEGIMDGVADTPEKLDKYIRTIYNKANEMDRLINELTYYSKIDTNRMPYTFTKINVREYFADCKEELKLELESERVEFIYTEELEEDVLIIADAEQLKRAIHNIINNSVKYMDKPERLIKMRLSDSGDFIRIDIEDNGKGIPKKDQAKVFDRFFRTDASRNSGRGGSGIGLSIVRKILEDHGGKVWAGGEEGKGTIMSFILRKYQEVPYHE